MKIKISNLSKTFTEKKILKDLSFDVFSGESLVIIGASGSGKSLLMKCMLGLIVADAGTSIVINGKEVGQLHISKRSDICKNIGVSFQGNALFDSMTIGENLEFAIKSQEERRGNVNIMRDMDAEEKTKLRSKVIEKLLQVDLDADIIDLYPQEISGGMQKRISLARALVSGQDIIFLDEPTSGLDPVTAAVIIKLIKRLHSTIGCTIVSITHDRDYAKGVATRIAVLESEQISWIGRFDVDDRASLDLLSKSTFLHKFMGL